MDSMKPILHITTKGAWETAISQQTYRGDTLESEGFIHCSDPHQIVGVANNFYRGQHGLMLLVIDPDRLTANVVYEDLYNAGQAFPHIYGPLNLDAVIKVVDFPPEEDGTFTLPEMLVN